MMESRAAASQARRRRSHQIGAMILLALFMHGVSWQIVGFHASTECAAEHVGGNSSRVETVDHRHIHHEDCSICRMQRQISSTEVSPPVTAVASNGRRFAVVPSISTRQFYSSAEAVTGTGRGPPHSVLG